MAETGLLRRQSQLCLPPPRDKRAVFKAQNRHGLENKELKKISLPRWSQCAGVGSSFVTTVPRWWGVTIMGRLCHAGEGHKVNFILSWTASLSLFSFMLWRRKWQPTPVFLPGESQGRGSLVVHSHPPLEPWDYLAAPVRKLYTR